MSNENISELMKNVHGFLKSLKYLFLKKLSTGSDEASFNKKQILGLNELIEKREREVKDKRQELDDLKATRVRDNENKRQEIEKLKEKLENVDKSKKNKQEIMKMKNLEQQKINQKIHLEKVIDRVC
jgi:Skp family chaperone for outer membrane proteins